MLEAKSPGVLLLLDLDHFKRVNDLHGHAAGDRLLLAVAEALRESAPDGACCARTGGDEFAMLLAGDPPIPKPRRSRGRSSLELSPRRYSSTARRLQVPPRSASPASSSRQ